MEMNVGVLLQDFDLPDYPKVNYKLLISIHTKYFFSTFLDVITDKSLSLQLGWFLDHTGDSRWANRGTPN